MIPLIGLIIAVYAVARLAQIPIESMHEWDYRWVYLAIISLPTIICIVGFTFMLVMKS